MLDVKPLMFPFDQSAWLRKTSSAQRISDPQKGGEPELETASMSLVASKVPEKVPVCCFLSFVIVVNDEKVVSLSTDQVPEFIRRKGKIGVYLLGVTDRSPQRERNVYFLPNAIANLILKPVIS